ncbi:MAG: hypothetical protein GYA16_11905 [Spirochaetes bacterium]|nr:hypothetical protein [Spirochaetota bacterium]
MSKQKNESIKCSKCNTTFNIVRWESINTYETPELKEVLFSGYLWKYQCPSCGNSIDINTALLYHNPEKRYMIQYEPSNRTYLEMKSRSLEICEEWEMTSPEMFEFLISNKYILRLVKTQSDLKEKIRIFDLGLNDIAVEAIKLSLHFSLAQGDNFPVKLVFYDIVNNNGLILFTFHYDDFINTESITIPVGDAYQITVDALNSVEIKDREHSMKYVDIYYADELMSQYRKKEAKKELIENKYCPVCKKNVSPTFHGLCPDCDSPL